eukprot:g41489.t1
MKANPRKAWAILRRFLGNESDSPRQIENDVGEVVVGKDAATVFAEQYHKQLNRPSNLPAPPIHEIASVTGVSSQPALFLLDKQVLCPGSAAVGRSLCRRLILACSMALGTLRRILVSQLHGVPMRSSLELACQEEEEDCLIHGSWLPC